MQHRKIIPYILTVLFTATLVLTILKVIPNHNPKIYSSFSPNNNTKEILLDLINRTNNEILVAMYTFTNKDLAVALFNAKQRGVKIKVIADQCNLKFERSQINFLTDNGIDVSIFKPNPKLKYPPLMHNKFATFDIDNNTKITSTGSLNWTNAALKYNQENILVIDNKEIFRRYRNQFQLLASQCVASRCTTYPNQSDQHTQEKIFSVKTQKSTPVQ